MTAAQKPLVGGGGEMRYTVYKFPSKHGTPRDFRWYWQALFYALFGSSEVVYELKDRKKDTYKSYWMTGLF